MNDAQPDRDQMNVTSAAQPAAQAASPAVGGAEHQLVIRDLHVVPVADPSREILAGIDLTVAKGEVHAIMGPNGSGKTTLAYALMGHPAYKVTAGRVIWKGRTSWA